MTVLVLPVLALLSTVPVAVGTIYSPIVPLRVTQPVLTPTLEMPRLGSVTVVIPPVSPATVLCQLTAFLVETTST